MRAHRSPGFTLLEICLALAIGVMIIALSVPSIAGLLAEQRLKRSFERFDLLVSEARVRSVSEQRAYALVWDRKEIVLVPRGREAAHPPTEEEAQSLVFEDKERFQLRRSAALTKNPPDEWIFWRNGTCEPVEISFEGAAGSWVVKYDPLTARGTFLRSDIP